MLIPLHWVSNTFQTKCISVFLNLAYQPISYIALPHISNTHIFSLPSFLYPVAQCYPLTSYSWILADLWYISPLLPAPNRCQSLCSDRPSYSLSHLSGHTGPSKLSWDFAVSGNSWSSVTGHPPVCPSVRLQWPPCYAWFQFSTVQKQMTLLWQSRMAVQKQITLLWLNVRR